MICAEPGCTLTAKRRGATQERYCYRHRVNLEPPFCAWNACTTPARQGGDYCVRHEQLIDELPYGIHAAASKWERIPARSEWERIQRHLAERVPYRINAFTRGEILAARNQGA